ncbi:MAG: NINE protein [Chloroflexi bacterium]|nr:NINE protein [Chloroflexota bacterium]
MLPSRFWTRVFLRYFVVFVLVWILLVLYPNPGKLVTSVKRILNPHTDPAAVASLAQSMDYDDPALIEKEVLRLIPYSYDWETHGMPWYCPSVPEVLRKGKGDCKARALVLASVLDAKGIPNRIVWSIQHVWVDYPGKEGTNLEKDPIYQKDSETGEKSWSLPRIRPQDILSEVWSGFVRAMPGMRMFLLVGGVAALAGLRAIRTRKGEVSSKSRLTAALLALFLGVFGAHRFYAGHIKTAIAMLTLFIVGAATVWIVVGIPFILAVSAWALFDLIDAIGGVAKDKQGRLIRNW